MKVEAYAREDGSVPFEEWLQELDSAASSKVIIAQARLTLGNTSNVKWFDGIGEYRINWGPGYRIYLAADEFQEAQEKEVVMAALTKDISEIVNDRIRCDPALAVALLDESLSLFLNGEPDTARLILRDLVNATIGFEGLAIATAKSSKRVFEKLKEV